MVNNLTAPDARRLAVSTADLYSGAPVAVRKRTRTAALAIGAVLAVGALLRVQGVPRFALEQDELYTIIEATRLWDSPFNPGIEARPLYYLLQHVIFEFVPASVTSIRVPAVVFGVLGLWLTWATARRLFGTAAGLSATALLAVSPWHLHASGMGRYWSLVYLLATAFYYLLIRSAESDRSRLYALTLVVLLLGTATHPTFLFSAAGATLGMLLVCDDGRFGLRRPSKRALQYLWLPLALVLMVIAALVLGSDNESAVQNWGGRGYLATLRLLPGMVDWTTPSLAVAGGLGSLFLLWSGDPGRRRFAMVAVMGCLSAAVLLTAASLRTNVYADYAFSALPLIVLAAGGLVQMLVERVQGSARPIGAAAVIVIAAGMLPVTASHLSDGTRFDYRPAFGHIERNAPELPVVTWPLILLDHYAPELQAVELPMRASALDAVLERHPRFWTVASVRRHGIAKDDTGEVGRWLSRHCQLEFSSERPRFDYRLYRVELHLCGAIPGAAAQLLPPKVSDAKSLG